MSDPKILFWDIETSHNVIAKFSLRDEFTPHTNIIQERYMICGAWKLAGEKRVQTVSVLDDPKRYSKTPHDDFHVVKTLHGVIEEADVIVAHNGDKFDTKWLNGRVLFHGLPPLPPKPSVDTYKVAKRHFSLNSNRLDYLGQYLGVGRKRSTPAGLWMDVLRGDAKAVEKMVRYNRGDVTLLESIFEKLRPYISENINRQLWQNHDGCPRCGSANVHSRGWHASVTQVYRRFQCVDCGGWFRKRQSEKARTSKDRLL